MNVAREKPSVTIRINAPENDAQLLARHVIPKFLSDYPDVTIDPAVTGNFVDIVEKGFNAGVMLAAPFHRIWSSSALATAQFVPTSHPLLISKGNSPHALRTIGSFTLAFDRSCRAENGTKREFQVHPASPSIDVTGPLVLSPTGMIVEAALQDVGSTFVLERWTRPHVEAGTLSPLLEDQLPKFPSLLPGPPAMGAFIDVLRRRSEDSFPVAAAARRPIQKDGQCDYVIGETY